MRILDRLLKRETVLDVEAVSDPLLRAIISDTQIDRQRALSIPAVSSAVDFICNTFAMIPFKLYREKKTDGKKVTEEVDDDRVRLINDDTGDKLDGFQFKKAMCEDFLLGTGGYAFIKKIGNKFVGLFYVEDSYISILKNADPIYKVYDIQVNGQSFNDFDFIKLLRNTKDGASGVGLTDEIGRALKTAYRRLLYEYDLTATGGSRKGFVKSSKHLDEKAMMKLKKAWQDYYSGNANTVILNDGLDFKEATNTSKENEINAKQITFNNEIREIFHLGKTYEETIKNAIMPIATAFATALNRDFLLETEKGSFYFAPDTKELYKGSLKERYEAYQIAIKNGFKTRNEIRYLEDDDALEGLDVVNLGLGDVLLNPNTGLIYTPNTNALVKMGEKAEQPVRQEILKDNQAAVSSVEEEIKEDIAETVRKPLLVGQIQALIQIVADYQVGKIHYNQALNTIIIGIGLSEEEAKKLLDKQDDDHVEEVI